MPTEDAEHNRPTIFVTGYGNVQITPDIAVLRFYVHRVHPEDPLAAYRSAANAAQQVIATLREEGVADEDMATVDVETDTRYHTDRQGRRHLMEHVVRYILEARVRDLEGAGRLIGRALAAGASEASLWSFEISNRRQLERQALASAMRHARERAAVVAEAAGVQLGMPVQISVESSSYGRRHRSYEAAVYASAPADEPSVPVHPGQAEITARVEVTYAIEPLVLG